MASVSSQIIENSNASAISGQTAKATSTQTSTSSSTVSSFDFLKLMTMQLQYQDPTNPMDNSEMLAQEAQFATLEQMEALQSSFSSFSNIYQANSLMGQIVEVTHNDNAIVGKVDYIDFSDSNGASVSVNGTLYPLSEVTKVCPDYTSSSDSEETKNLLSSIGNTLEKLTGSVSDIAQKILGSSNSEIE